MNYIVFITLKQSTFFYIQVASDKTPRTTTESLKMTIKTGSNLLLPLTKS